KLQSFSKPAGNAAPTCDPIAFANEVAANLGRAAQARSGEIQAPGATPSGGVPLEHIEQLLERLWDESIDGPPELRSSPQPSAAAADAAPVEAIPGPDVMPMQTVHEASGSIHDAG